MEKITITLTRQQADYVAWALWMFLGEHSPKGTLEAAAFTRETLKTAGAAIEVANKRDGEWSTAFFQEK